MKRVPSSVTGTLRSYAVKVGDTINAGQEIAVVESMKMLLPVLAEAAGKVTALTRKIDELVHEGDTLLELE